MDIFFSVMGIASEMGTTQEEYLNLLREHGANCQYRLDCDNLYFSDHETAERAMEALEALAIMNKLTE